MTSGSFSTVPVDSITINRDERQRKALTGIEELAASIARSGLIHPPVITRDNVLVAGERRYTAIRHLGWTHIPVQYVDDLDPLQLQLIELEENTRRVDIDWKDQCLAIERYHSLRLQTEEGWNASRTAEALGVSYAEVTQKCDVAKELTTGNKMVQSAEKYSVARGLVERKKARSKTEMLQSISLTPTNTEPTSEQPIKRIPILNTDFISWAENYTDEPFNFLHCDFPYGVKVGGHGQAADAAYGNYDDDPKIYWKLIEVLAVNLDKLVAPSAHLMFWFSMKHYERTRLLLMEMGWQVSLHPLVWGKSDNTGIIPTVEYGPRQIYETAFHCFRGKRPVVRPIANLYWGPAPKTIHMSEKPIVMLEHFFRMYVDDSTRLLDPTCGSGNSLKAALRHGAKTVQGIERDENFYGAAVAAWESV